MNSLSLSTSTISLVINDPSKLAIPSNLGMPQEIADKILDQGYTHGFRTVFIVNASLAAAATVASIFMIKQKDLTRDDEKKSKEGIEPRAEDKEKVDAVEDDGESTTLGKGASSQ